MKVEKPVAGLPEYREFAIEDVELRAAASGSKSPGGVRFYAAVYGPLSLNLGGFRERVAPGAFDKALQEDDVRALFNHDKNLVLGRQKPGRDTNTAQITSDERGLLVDIPELPNTNAARDLYELLSRGDVDQSSFGFRTVADSWNDAPDDGGVPIRTLEEARLFDVSPVTFPAYPDTSAEARALALALDEIRAGKVLSAHSRGLVASARDALDALLTHADGASEEENSVDETERHAADSGERQTPEAVEILRLRLRELELAPGGSVNHDQERG